MAVPVQPLLKVKKRAEEDVVVADRKLQKMAAKVASEDAVRMRHRMLTADASVVAVKKLQKMVAVVSVAAVREKVMAAVASPVVKVVAAEPLLVKDVVVAVVANHDQSARSINR